MGRHIINRKPTVYNSVKLMSEIILPCPFCGAPGVLEEVESHVKGEVVFSVGCNSQEEATCMGYQSLTTFARRGDAIDAWNKRAPIGTKVEVA